MANITQSTKIDKFYVCGEKLSTLLIDFYLTIFLGTVLITQNRNITIII